MPDLLSHVLAGFTIATILAIRYEWITRHYVTVAMVGAVVPDIGHLEQLVPSYVVQYGVAWVLRQVGVGPLSDVYFFPFAWTYFHTVAGSVAVVAVASLFFGKNHRRRVFTLAALGAVSHHALDLFLISHDGQTYAVFWPITLYEPTLPGLYRSSDRWLVLLLGSVSAVSWYLVRYRDVHGRSPSRSPTDP